MTFCIPTLPRLPGRPLAAATALIFLGSASVALAQDHAHLDISPYLDGNNKIVTGGFNDDTGMLEVLVERVFLLELEFAEDFGVDEPALNSAPGAFFQPGNTLGMDFVTQLFFWDGTGDVDFSPVSDGSEIRIFQGIDTGIFLNGDGPAGDYYWAVANSNGVTHEHAFSQYYGGDSTGLTNVGTVTPGIYYALGQVLDEDGLYTPSDTLALVYNTGGESFEEAHEQAETFIRNNVVPEPTSMALLGLGGLALLRRRR